uniref:CDC42 effector protein (Rho GTPase binding) 1b n=1 Tax=Neolamprologus brichardi TaxID=32507 RepID=A0A3Q4G5J5_NEOBR
MPVSNIGNAASDLSVDMISPPLGDFRHTMHVGRGGDVFGDTSFLSNYGGIKEPGSPDSTSDISPIIKNAISLPQLNIDSPNGCLQRSGFVTLPRLSRIDRQFHDGNAQKGSAPDSGRLTRTRSDSLTSFTVDLGPSLMAEVLGLIDDPNRLRISNHSQEAGEEEQGEEGDDNSSLTETPVQTPLVTSPDLSVCSGSIGQDTNNRRCSGTSDLTEEEDRKSVRTPDASARSPHRSEPVMEAERFQKAADVLSRHYGGGSFTKGVRRSSSGTNQSISQSREASHESSEEEEEIKV